ncbi:fat storage-inducing transmembrane protein 1-like [Pezoporus occidentalis]|uniref:fat storage-inducing transmembrane protein 1-like n=1 Tax=Pezoporus occidentalis TaxID=407982 RepID=UPI002F91B5F0
MGQLWSAMGWLWGPMARLWGAMGCCGALIHGLCYGAAAVMASPLFPRVHALALALLVGLGPTLKARADPHSILASPHNLLETRLLRSAGSWTALLALSLAVASLPLLRPTGGAVARAAARWAVGAALSRGAPRWLWDSLVAATGRCWARGAVHGGALLLPYGDPRSCRAHGHQWEGFGVSPQAFALVHCGLGLAEEGGAAIVTYGAAIVTYGAAVVTYGACAPYEVPIP